MGARFRSAIEIRVFAISNTISPKFGVQLAHGESRRVPLEGSVDPPSSVRPARQASGAIFLVIMINSLSLNQASVIIRALGAVERDGRGSSRAHTPARFFLQRRKGAMGTVQVGGAAVCGLYTSARNLNFHFTAVKESE